MRINDRTFHDLRLVDRIAMRSQYRRLRMALYAPQSSEYATNGMYQGHYGMPRHEAKGFLSDFYSEVSMSTYESEK